MTVISCLRNTLVTVDGSQPLDLDPTTPFSAAGPAVDPSTMISPALFQLASVIKGDWK
jgi:hypothetical protein